MKKVITEAVFSSPLDNTSVNSKFGPRWGRNHNGVDLAANAANVKSPLDGVVDVGEIRNDSCGGTIIITHPDGFKTGYCHMQKINVRQGQKVRKGDIIGVSGGGANDPGRGRSDGRHLHFTLRKDGKLVDPMQYIDKVNVSSSDISFSGATPSNDGGANWDDFFSGNISDPKIGKSKKFSDPILGQILKPLEDALNLKTEMRQIIKPLTESYSLKNGNQFSSYEYVINTGRDIVSPEKGIVLFVGDNSECKNALIISHVIGGKKYYTQFCNVDRPKVSKNETVKAGQKIGLSSTNVLVTILNSSKSQIKFKEIDSIEKKLKDDDLGNVKDTKSSSKKSNNPLLSLLLKPLDVLDMDDYKTISKSDKVPEYKWVNWAKKNISSTSKNESVERNINKIKKLL